MRTLTFLALFLASAVSAVAQQQAATELTPEAVFADKVKMQAAGSSAADELIYLRLAQRRDAQATARSEFVNRINATRTDMQVGASSNAPGATTLVEKPGAADLLQLAIESGAVSETKNGTSVTLATTPYMLAGFFGVRDTPEAWRTYAPLRHVALSASFSNDAEVDKGDLTSVQSAEVKWTILGNRSPRDAAVAVALQPELTKFAQSQIAVNRVCTDPSGIVDFDTMSDELATWFRGQPANSIPSNAAVEAKIDEIFGGVTIDPAHQNAISACADQIVLKQAAANQFVSTMATLSAAYVALNKAHQLSIAASSHRDAKVDDFTTLKILYGKNTVPKLSINLNGEANFNQHHNAKNLHQIRSFAVEGGLTMGRFNEGRFDATVSGKLWRNEDSEDRNVSVVQVKGNVYLANSLILPVSLSYASKPVDTIRKGFQINLGIASLLDSFLTKSLAATP